MQRQFRDLGHVLWCGLLALLLSLTLAAVERPASVPSLGRLRPLSEWSTLQDTVTARALFTPQEAAVAPVEWQPVRGGGGYVVMPINFKGTTHDRASWDLPVKADLIEIKGTDKARIYAVRVDCAGLRPVTGYLSVPKAVGDGATFPARLETHGYSGDSCVHRAPSSARDNEVVLNINAHGLKLVEFGATEADTKALR